MRLCRLLITVVLLALAGRTSADNLSMETVFMGAGETKEVAIMLNNPSKQYVAFQFDVVLPDGIIFALNDKGKPIVSLDANRADDHSLNVKDLGNNTYRLLAFSMTNAAFAGTNGVLVNMTLKTVSNITAGAKTVSITGQTFTEASAAQVKWSDMSFMVQVLSAVTIKADNKTRVYGEDNPEWTYTVTSGQVYGNGTPVVNCAATAASPAGSYDITVEKGTLQNPATLTKGTLTITKAPLTITAGSYTMKQGDPLPSFDVSYEGFKNGETPSVLTTQPTISCSATSASAPGTYDIIVSGAVADNYDISYVKGTLTIEAGSFTLTYVVNGETYKTVSYNYGESITPESEPTKEGYTFSGWSGEPSTMPSEDVTVTGTFTVNYYKLTYMVDGEVYKSSEVEYGVGVVAESAPTKEGYTFSGWSEISGSMPAHDVTVTGSFTKGSYTLTYVVNGETYKTVSYDYGESITPESEPTKEGYTFSGWSEIPSTMPSEDVTVTGSFTVNYYKLTYMVDGEVYKSSEVEYGVGVVAESAPTKEGYTFSGWSEIPSSMPAHDVTVMGSFTKGSYKLTYVVNGETYKTVSYDYGESITPESEPTKDGYTFSGWSGEPSTMPAEDVTVTGSFTVNYYKLTYMVDGEVYKTSEVEYGVGVVPESAPTKEGYTFSGWSEIPSSMPAHDVTVTGSFTKGNHTLTYVVDGETYKTVSYDYGSSITPESEPTKEGYTFSGWSYIPSTMPAENVTVTGSFTVNTYKLTYMVDGEVYKTFEVKYGTPITPEAEPTKEGQTFSGWSEIPKTMPATDVVVTGTFTKVSYTLTYMVDGKVYKAINYNTGETITRESEPEKEGYTFSGWSWIPSKMPDEDVTITGFFTVNNYKLTYMIDGKVYKEVEVEYGATITPEPQPEGDYVSFCWTGLPETMPAKDVTVQADYVTGINGAALNDKGQMINDKWYDLLTSAMRHPVRVRAC